MGTLIFRGMRVMARGTTFAGTLALGEIPVAIHAAVRPVLKISPLRPVTLRTQGHHISELDAFIIG